MASSEAENFEEKLTSLLGQLHLESGILHKMIYKNKNQHRRGSYFRYLLQVGRDLRLLQATKLEDLVSSCFQVIGGKKPKQKIHLLESLKRRKCEVGKYNFMERLLGAARLLSEMVEPIFKAATQYYTTNQQPSLINFWWVTHSRKEKRSYGPSLCGPSFGVFGWKETIWSSTIKRSLLSEISTLLARRFFTGFCFMILALLARIRVLVQQILIDVVSVFNMVSSISQKKHTVTINQEGIQVFREFYPTNEEFVFLQCVWKEDKFVLQETKQNFESRNWQENLGPSVSLSTSAIQYTSIESFLEGRGKSKH
ncbi:uncharacterized protein LOC111023972 isoform X4 [Momordica charantia]|uniref:Uncharacterized protein LOC111023972 isoform X4 n=1 Tax=Momordica charantia TaxID=3673 RepID=A0A6J1DXA4_MOMCH|nr:uncharacterized protein LOC111023972 isoform X4 [Momordica charantia]